MFTNVPSKMIATRARGSPFSRAATDVARSLVCARSRDNIVIFISASSLPWSSIVISCTCTVLQPSFVPLEVHISPLSPVTLRSNIDRRGTRVKKVDNGWPTFPNLFVLDRSKHRPKCMFHLSISVSNGRRIVWIGRWLIHSRTGESVAWRPRIAN